jgi:hypothetical protein
MFSVNAKPAAVSPAYTMPSITPSNSRRRHHSSPSSSEPFIASSTSGADTVADRKSPPPSPSTASPATRAVELINNEDSVATHAPQPNAASSSRGGSGSQRSIHRNAPTTNATGSSAVNAPTSTPTAPTSTVTNPNTARPQIPMPTAPNTGSSTLRRCCWPAGW